MLRGITIPPDPLSIVLEYCPGGSLRDWLSVNGHLMTDIDKVELAKDVAKGLDFLVDFNFELGIHHLHTGGSVVVIHRDLAARNILVIVLLICS